MRTNRLVHGVLTTAVLIGCGESTAVAPGSMPGTPPVSTVPRDIVIPGLPSPYYHFERDASGRIARASFASGLVTYDVVYDGGRISEMRSTRVDSLFREIGTVVTRDTLLYFYDDAGRVSEVRYADSTGAVYTRVHFAYDGRKLMRLARERRSGSRYFIDKTMSFSYDADGNALEIAQRRTPLPGNPEGATYVDRFEQYDNGINVDGFSLLHDEFSDHLVLLPDVQLQKGNPRRQIRSGDGLNFRVDYRYTYDDRNRPLTKNGEATVLTGDDAGRRFQLSSVFSY